MKKSCTRSFFSIHNDYCRFMRYASTVHNWLTSVQTSTGPEQSTGRGGSTVPHNIIAKLISMIPIPLSGNKWTEEKEGLTFQLLRLSAWVHIISCKKTAACHGHLKLGRQARSGANWKISFKSSSHSAHTYICFQLSYSYLHSQGYHDQ